MRILIVEDEPALGKLLKSNLEAEAYAVDLETDGERGLGLARTNDYSVVILDDILPGMRGFEVCRELRSAGRMMPIIFMSVQGEVDTKIQSLDVGADDYIAKPFSYAEFSARIRALIRRPQTVHPAELRVEDLVLDMDAMNAIRGGKRIDLTNKEYALLHYLMRNVGRLVSRAMILEHVWDDGADPFSNAIEAHIYNLRKKIDAPGLKKLITTVPGRGYILFRKF
jgi:DNA-binding response OmpR family regulator